MIKSKRFYTKLFITIVLMSSFTISNASDKIGEALFKAVTSKDMGTVKNLVEEKGADVNYVRRINSAFFIPVLMQAVMDDSSEIATYLINKGADVNARDGFKMTCLMWAADRGNIELVKLLLVKGADKDLADDNGLTAFKAALDQGHKEIAELLKNN